jgi:WD40 repeat protein
MAVLKTPCPECDAKLRLIVEGDGDHEVECPKCGASFTAVLEVNDPPSRTTKAKKSGKSDESERAPKGKARNTAAGKKAVKRRDDDDDDNDDDEDDRPRRRRREDDEDESGKKKLLIAGGVAAVLMLAGAGAIVFAVTSKDKDQDTTAQKSDSTPAATQPTQPGTGPGANPTSRPTPTPAPGPNSGPKPNPGPGPGPGPKPPVTHGPGSGPKPPITPGTGTGPKPNTSGETELATGLPPPPKIRISGSVVPTDKPIVRPPAIPPLAPDEDPFVRAKEFQPDGPLPTLPKLGDRNHRPLLTLEAGGHTDLIGKVFFTPKGDRIITIAQDKAVRIWDPATNESTKTIRFPAGPGKEGSLFAAAVARSGKQLAVAGYPVGNTPVGKVPIYIVSPETGLPIKTIAAASGPVNCLHYSNDGKWLGVGCDNGAIQMVDVARGVAYPAPGRGLDPASIREVKFNPDQKLKLLATLDAGNIVNIWNFQNASQHKKFQVGGTTPTTLAWSRDGWTLAVGTNSGSVMVGTRDGKLIKSLPRIMYNGKPVVIWAMEFLPGNTEIAVAGVGGNAAGWAGIIHADTGKIRVAFKQHSNVIFALDVSPDGKKVVTSGGSQHETYVWSSEDGKVLNRFVGSGNGVWSIAWAKDGKSLAWGTSNIRNENHEGKLEHTFRLDEFGVGNPPDPSKYTQMVTSDDHAKLIVKSPLFLVQTTGRDPKSMALRDSEGKLDKIFSATVLPKGNAVVVAGASSLALFNPASARELRKFVGHTGNVLCVTPSPEGKLFATGSSDQTIRIWHRDHEEPLLSIFVAGHDWIAWTPQGYYACSGQGERLIAWQIGIGTNKVPWFTRPNGSGRRCISRPCSSTSSLRPTFRARWRWPRSTTRHWSQRLAWPMCYRLRSHSKASARANFRWIRTRSL